MWIALELRFLLMQTECKRDLVYQIMDIDSCFRNGESGAEDGRSEKGGRGKRIYTPEGNKKNCTRCSTNESRSRSNCAFNH